MSRVYCSSCGAWVHVPATPSPLDAIRAAEKAVVEAAEKWANARFIGTGAPQTRKAAHWLEVCVIGLWEARRNVEVKL